MLNFRYILLGLVSGLAIVSAQTAKAQGVPIEVKQQVCSTLVDHFEYIYQLRVDNVEEPLVEEIVARDPALDPVLQFPLYAATKVIYAAPIAQLPDVASWIYATQLACIRVIGTDFLEPRGKFRLVYGFPRMGISYQ